MKNQENFINITQDLHKAIYTCNKMGFITTYNKAAVNLWGREPEVNKDLWCGSLKIYNKDGSNLPHSFSPMAIAIKECRPVYGEEMIIQQPDGTLRHVLPFPVPSFDKNGKITGAVNMLLDITDKKEQEILIQQSEEKYRTFIEQATDAILIYSFDGTIHEFNDSCCKLSGYSREEYATLKLSDILVGDLIVNQQNYTAIMAENTVTLNRQFKRKDGELLDIEVKIKMLEDGKVIAFGRDITERKRAEKILEVLKQKLIDQKVQAQKKITRAIIKAAENERRHIGVELHDNINQMLAGTKLYMTIAGNKDSAIKEALQYPLELIDETMNEIRLLTRKSVTPAQNINLKELVQLLVEGMDTNTELKTLFVYKVSDDFCDDDIKLNIYRIIQEQTSNIIKHAAAGNVEILIKTNKKDISIIVKDDGIGFDESKKRTGIGISNIIHRVESFNGEVIIKSAPGKGCDLKVKIPY